MKRNLLLLLVLSCGLTAHAQSSGRFTVVRNVIAGGGTTFSTAGTFTLGSTIAQPLAAVPSSSRFSIQGGFWITPSFLVFAPARAGNSFTFSFETMPGRTYVVEYANSLFNPNWQPLPTVNGDGSVKSVTDTTATPGQRYYRLREQ